jgi:membrane protein
MSDSIAKAKRAFKRASAAWGEIMSEETTTNASAFAYNTIFSIPSLLILILTIAAVVDRATSINVTNSIQRLIREHAPDSTEQLLSSMVDQTITRVGSGGASLGILVTAVIALWSGANAVASLIRGFNQAYGVEETRSAVQLIRIKLGLTLLMALTINLAFVAVVFGNRIGNALMRAFDLGSAFSRWWNLWTWPFAIVIVAVLLAVLYSLGPNVDLPFRWISPGSAATTIMWLAAAGLFGVYLAFSNPGSGYGALGSVIVLLFFLYLTGLVFILGAKLNAELRKRYEPSAIDELERSGSDGLIGRVKRRFRRWVWDDAMFAAKEHPAPKKA